MTEQDSESATIAGIHHASLIVADITRAQIFYQDILGLVVDPRRPDMRFPGVWLQVGKQQIHLLEVPQQLPKKTVAHGGHNQHIALQVTDLDLIARRLRQSKLEFELSKSGRRALFCRDPDANVLEFVELQD